MCDITFQYIYHNTGKNNLFLQQKKNIRKMVVLDDLTSCLETIYFALPYILSYMINLTPVMSSWFWPWRTQRKCILFFYRQRIFIMCLSCLVLSYHEKDS